MPVQLVQKVRQPFRTVRIDWSNPVTLGLISAASPFGFDSVRGKGIGYNSAAPSFAQSKFGTGVNLGQNQFDFPVIAYGNTNQTHLVIAEKQTTGTWKVCSANHGMVIRQFNSLITFCSTNYGNVFTTTSWSGVCAVIHTIGSDENSTQNVYVNGEQVSWSFAELLAASGANGNINTIGGSHSGDRSSATWWDKPILLSARWNRVLAPAEIKSVSANPWQIFEPETIPLFFSTVTAQFLRPISDVSNSGWTPSTGSDLFAMIGETVRNDATYISATEPGAICEVLLGTSSGHPLSSINHLPRIVMSAGTGGIIVRLKQGATVIKAWAYASLTGTDTLYEPTLTSGEIDSITDYTDLRLEMETTA